MSVRGEQFWLDKTRAAQFRPRARPRYTLTPSIVLKNGQPFMALGTPGGDNQDQTILQAFLNVVEFWPDWYPEPARSFRVAARADATFLSARSGRTTAGFNKLNVEAAIPDAVFDELKARGHDVARSAVQHCQLRDGRDRRPGTGQSDRRRRSAARLLRDGLLTFRLRGQREHHVGGFLSRWLHG